MDNENAPHIHMEYYSVVKKNEITNFAGKLIEKNNDHIEGRNPDPETNFKCSSFSTSDQM